MTFRKHVWVVSELYFPEETSTGGALTILAEGLAHTYRVRVLCSQPTYNARGMVAPWSEERNGVTIRRCTGTRFNKENLVFRLINVFTISISLASLALRHLRKDDCVIVVTNPPLLPFLIAAVCRLRRARPLLLIHDVYPDALTITGMVSPTSIAARVFDRLTRQLYVSVDKIIVLGRDMEVLVRRKLRKARQTVVMIPNCPHEPDRIRPTSRAANSLLKQLGLTEKFVVQYSGNMGRTHGLECLVEAAKKLADTDIHFLFIGWGAKKRWLEASVASLGLANVTVLPYLPRAELATSLNACDLAVISFVHGMVGCSVPGRMYNIMAAGKPILAVTDAMAELGLVVAEERIGWVVPPGDVTRVVDAIMQARTEPSLLSAMGRRSRELVESKYSVQNVIDQYVRLLEECE